MARPCPWKLPLVWGLGWEWCTRCMKLRPPVRLPLVRRLRGSGLGCKGLGGWRGQRGSEGRRLRWQLERARTAWVWCAPRRGGHSSGSCRWLGSISVVRGESFIDYLSYGTQISKILRSEQEQEAVQDSMQCCINKSPFYSCLPACSPHCAPERRTQASSQTSRPSTSSWCHNCSVINICFVQISYCSFWNISRQLNFQSWQWHLHFLRCVSGFGHSVASLQRAIE